MGIFVIIAIAAIGVFGIMGPTERARMNNNNGKAAFTIVKGIGGAGYQWRDHQRPSRRPGDFNPLERPYNIIRPAKPPAGAKIPKLNKKIGVPTIKKINQRSFLKEVKAPLKTNLGMSKHRERAFSKVTSNRANSALQRTSANKSMKSTVIEIKQIGKIGHLNR